MRNSPCPNSFIGTEPAPPVALLASRAGMWGDEATNTSHKAGAKANSEGCRLEAIWVSSCPRQLLLLLLVPTLTLQAPHTQFSPSLSSLPFSLQVQFLLSPLEIQGLTLTIHTASTRFSVSGTKAGPLHPWWPHQQRCWLLSGQGESYLSSFCIVAGVILLLL